jgi:Flavodoxin
MKKAVIIYSTTDGQTKNICAKLREHSKKKDSIDLFSIDEIEKIDLQGYEKIVLEKKPFDMRNT